MAELHPVELAERVAVVARDLGIETAVIGAYALAAHHYVRGTKDIDLGTVVELRELAQLQRALDAEGFSTRLREPDDEDPLGGVLVVWQRADDDGDPLYPLEVVNFRNPYRPRVTAAYQAIRTAIPVADTSALRYPQLKYLVALKLDTGGGRDVEDVVDVLLRNRDADLEDIRATCKHYGLDRIDEVIERVLSERARAERK